MLDTVMSMLGGSSKDAKAETDDGARDENKTEEVAEPTAVRIPDLISCQDGKPAPVNETKIEVPKAVEHAIPLRVVTTPTGIVPLRPEDKKLIVDRMDEMDKQDQARKARAEARNTIESFVYGTRDALETSLVKSVSTESERQALSTQLEVTSEWLYDDGDLPSTPTEEFRNRLTDLKKLYDPILYRKTESEKRADKISDFKKTVREAKEFLNAQYANVAEDDRQYTPEDVKAFEDAIAKVETWLVEKQAAQSKLADHQDPVLMTSDLQIKQAEVGLAQRLFKNKKRPKKTTATTTTTTSATESKTATDQEEATPPVVAPETEPVVDTDGRDEL
jgi:hypoxia up-regulated 1